MKAVLFPALLALSCSPPEERSSSSTIGAVTPASASAVIGEMVIHPVYHSAVEFEWGPRVILVDPNNGAERYKAFPPADLILITHTHADHMDTATLRGLDRRRARIIAPQAVVDQLPEDLASIAHPLANGARTEVLGIGVEAIPMYNMTGQGEPRHPKGRGNGYVLTFDHQRVYVSGDTEDIPEMRALKDIDVAFVCMNLPYTMSVDQAASGVLAFKPRVVYPYHYRGQDGFSDVARFKQLVNAGDPNIDVRLVDWYKE